MYIRVKILLDTIIPEIDDLNFLPQGYKYSGGSLKPPVTSVEFL